MQVCTSLRLFPFPEALLCLSAHPSPIEKPDRQHVAINDQIDINNVALTPQVLYYTPPLLNNGIMKAYNLVAALGVMTVAECQSNVRPSQLVMYIGQPYEARPPPKQA